MDTLDLTQFLGIAGAGALINVLVEAFKRFLRWTQEDTERVAPLLSLALGVLLFVTYTAVNPVVGASLGQGIVQAVVTGIISGGTAAGIYQLGGKEVIRSVAGTPAAIAREGH